MTIDTNKLAHNGRALVGLCGARGIGVSAVTKAFCAEAGMVAALAGAGFDYLADSRMENIGRYPAGILQRRMLIRLPAVSRAAEVVAGCDVSLNSEIAALARLADAAEGAGRIHGIVLMLDLGDLREGIFYQDAKKIDAAVEYALGRRGLDLVGIGTNLTCYGGVLPARENLGDLVNIGADLRRRYGIDLPLISGGNSSSLYLLENGEMPDGITNLRLGEAILCGHETGFRRHIGGLYQDVFRLSCEIIEISEKPSMPIGRIVTNAFGEDIADSFADMGLRRRAILAIGRQDIDHGDIIATAPGIAIIGASSDHLIIDISDSPQPLAVGDCLDFIPGYGSILRAFSGRYIERVYL